MDPICPRRAYLALLAPRSVALADFFSILLVMKRRKGNKMGERIKVTDQGKLTLLYERFRDVCLVEKEVWKEIFMPREVTQGPVRTNVQDRYDVEIDDPAIEDALDANIPRGSQALAAAIQEYRANISFYRKT